MTVYQQLQTNPLLNGKLLRSWGDKHYTSACDINQAYKDGLVNREVSTTEFGAWYTYTTKEDRKICSFYKDSTFGFGSQYYGILCTAPCALYPELYTHEAHEEYMKEWKEDYLRRLELECVG